MSVNDVAEVLSRTGTADGTTTFPPNGQKYHLLTLPGDVFSYRYVAIITDEELTLAMSSSIRMLLIAAAIVATLAMLVIVRMVQAHLKPIQLIHGLLSDQKPEGNELIEIRDSVQHLIDENRALSNRAEDYAGRNAELLSSAGRR